MLKIKEYLIFYYFGYMLLKTSAIILKSIKHGETSFISQAYTSELGWRSYIINGVRKSKTKNQANLLQPLSILDLVVYEQAHREMQRIKDLKYQVVYQSIPFDIRKLSIGIFITEILCKSLRSETNNPHLFEFLVE